MTRGMIQNTHFYGGGQSGVSRRSVSGGPPYNDTFSGGVMHLRECITEFGIISSNLTDAQSVFLACSSLQCLRHILWLSSGGKSFLPPVLEEVRVVDYYSRKSWGVWGPVYSWRRTFPGRSSRA